MRKQLPIRSVKKPKRKSWLAVGVDTSTSSIALAGIAYDSALDKMRGPFTSITRWTKEDEYLARLGQLSRAEDFILDLVPVMGVDLDMTFIAVEEPFPAHGGFTVRGKSSSLLQQAEVSGAFRGGLARYGYHNIYQVPNKTWKALVAEEMGMKQNSSFTKFTIRDWAREAFDIPEWPDLIRKNGSLVPRPEGSVAQAVQPDDRHDAIALACYMQGLVEEKVGTAQADA